MNAMCQMLAKIAVTLLLTVPIPAVLPPAVWAQSCQQDGAGAKPPKDHWAFDAIAELAAKGLIEGYPEGTFRGDRAMTRYEPTMLLARLGADAIAGEAFDLLLAGPNAVDTNGDGKKDTWVAKLPGGWFGVVDVNDDGLVDYVWNDKNGDGFPQTGELQKLNRNCGEVIIYPVRQRQAPQQSPNTPVKEPAERGTNEPGR